ncbi:MAG: ABC transporter ATP-binding protein [Nanoarchaeota archaeon]|nr:ABC transporter ATP-binding protein [Nanoarchaeota archaeon]
MFFIKYLGKYKGLLMFTLLLAVINQGFSLLDPQIIRLIIDNYATKATELPQDVFINGVIILLFSFIGVALVSRIAKNFQDYFVNVITQKVGTEMYADSVSHSFSLPYSTFEDQRSGELLQKLQKARTDTQQLIQSFINIAFVSLIGLLFVLVYAFMVHIWIGLAFSLLVPSVAWFIYSISKKIKKSQESIVKEYADLAGSTTETMRNVELVKSLGLEDQEIKRLNTVNDKILGLELKKIVIVRKLSFTQGTLINAIRTLLLFLMLWLLFLQHITLGEFLSLYFYSFFIFGPLGELSTIAAQYQEAKASNSILEKVLNQKPEEKPKNAKKIKSLNTIEFNNVSFNYGSNKENSLDNVSINIRSGEKIAFIGLSGSGKTTLVKLLLGLYKPKKGRILVNGISSDEIDYASFRNKIGLVSQETQLFAGTIKENLLFVKPDATDEECLKALELSQAGKILRKGSGLKTKIGEGGIKLSGGERQRLAIARALLRSPQLLIFDEATSSLDSLTEKEIIKTIESISSKKPDLIIVTVAHRLSTIAHSDKIIVLENGSIVEKGNHNTLLKKKGLYFALFREQGINRKS